MKTIITKNHWKFIDGGWVCNYYDFTCKMFCPYCKKILSSNSFDYKTNKDRNNPKCFAYKHHDCDNHFYLKIR